MAKNINPRPSSRLTPHPPVTFSIDSVHGILSGVRARGESCDAFLADAGIAPELVQQASARVTADQFIALFRSLTERRNDEALGFLSRPLRRGSFAMIVRSAMSAGTLSTAMHRYSRAFGLLQEDVTLKEVREGALAGCALHFADSTIRRPNFMHEMLLRSFWRVLAWLAGRSLPIARVDLAFKEPLQAYSYGSVFAAPVCFERLQSTLWFDAERLQYPVRRDEAALRVFLADVQTTVIVPRRGNDLVSARVRRELQQKLPAWPELAAAAAALHMSTSTLQRHLANEGTSFQSLKNELRRDMAITRLNTSTVPLAVLANDLGFADSGSFHRAFKAWTGSAPGAYRRRFA